MGIPRLQRGMIVIIPFPFSDPKRGYKSRPVVLMADTKNRQSEWIVSMITSQRYEQAIELEPSGINNLQNTSYARPDKLFTASPSLFKRRLGQLTSRQLVLLKNAIVEQF